MSSCFRLEEMELPSAVGLYNSNKQNSMDISSFHFFFPFGEVFEFWPCLFWLGEDKQEAGEGNNSFNQSALAKSYLALFSYLLSLISSFWKLFA